MEDYVILDISHWQGDMDEEKTIAAGAKAVIIRAGSVDKSSGVPYTDYSFYLNCDKFQEELPIGCYWYYRPEKDPLKQADYFADLLDDVFWYIPPIVDVESNDSNVSPYDFQRWLYKFTTHLEERVKVKPIIYTRGSFWNTELGEVPWASNHKLWVARYTTVAHPWLFDRDPNKYRPLPWHEYWLWQYSADGNRRGHEFGAESYDIDISRCSLPLDEFYKAIGWGEAEVPPDAPFRLPDNATLSMAPSDGGFRVVIEFEYK